MSDAPKRPTREEFVRRWRGHVAGIIALGGPKVRKLLTGPIESAASFGDTLFELDETTTALLGQLYDHLIPPAPVPVKPDQPSPGANGTAAGPKPAHPRR